MTEEQEWEPGIPLYRPGSYRDYFYNFRPAPGYDPNVDDSECRCGDRASWPEPSFGAHTLPPEEWFINKWKAEILDG
jgi:hypothetical protein